MLSNFNMDSVSGSWKYDMSRCPGLQAMWESSGIPKDKCTDDVMSNTVISISKDGGAYSYGMTMPGFPTKTSSFTPGQQFEWESPVGIVFKTTIKEEGSKVVHTMVNVSNGYEITTFMEVSGNEMKMSGSMNGQDVVLYLLKA